MLSKPKSSTTSWTNYHPILLLNLDIKHLAKILATHLNQVIGELIHSGQVGFIRLCQAGDNVRRASLLAHATKSRCLSECFLTLNIRKAFDTVSWSYLQYTLQKWGFGPHFLKWISSLYDKLKAYIQYAGFKSDLFPIGSGPCQGCPFHTFFLLSSSSLLPN